MIIKKMLLLSAMAFAAVAFAAPAGAQAAFPFWFTTTGGGDVKVGGPEEFESVTIEGSVSVTVSGVRIGPCTIHSEGKVWNEEEMGEGVIDEFKFLGPCTTSLSGCEITEASAGGLPWPVTLLDLNTKTPVDISEVGWTYTWGAGCIKYGIPNGTQTNVNGTITGKFDNFSSCARFENDGDLISGGKPALLDGSACFITETNPLTAY
jgi:hypothetical protein